MDANKFFKVGVGSLAIVIAIYFVYLMVVPLAVSIISYNNAEKMVDADKKNVYVSDSLVSEVSQEPTNSEQRAAAILLWNKFKNTIKNKDYLFIFINNLNDYDIYSPEEITLSEGGRTILLKNGMNAKKVSKLLDELSPQNCFSYSNWKRTAKNGGIEEALDGYDITLSNGHQICLILHNYELRSIIEL